MKIPWRELPARAATGVYILHSGWEKLQATEERSAGLHRMAHGAYPILRDIPPEQFTKALAMGEMGIGATLLFPYAPNRVAGAALTAFAAGLVTMYLRTPALHKPNSFWPTPAGMAIAKDIWLLGAGATLMLE